MWGGALLLFMTRECRTGLQILCRPQGVIQENRAAAIRSFEARPSRDEAWFIAGWPYPKSSWTVGDYTAGFEIEAGSSIVWIAS
jgi:hypothetical protein